MLLKNGIIKETIIKFDKDINQNQVNTLTDTFNKKLKGEPLSKIDLPLEQYMMNELSIKIDIIKPIIKQLSKAIKSDSRVYMKGADRVLDNPEFDQKDLTKRFFGLLEEDQISSILTGDDDINFYIGTPENGLEDLSIVTFKNRVNGKDMGTIGIIGPTRMDYSKVISVLKYINKELNKGMKLTEIKFPKMLTSRWRAIKTRSWKERNTS